MNQHSFTVEQLTGHDASHLFTLEIGNTQTLIHPEVAHDLQALRQAAQQAGFDLALASGYRSYQQQAHIWNEKFNGRRSVLDDESNPIDLSPLNEIETMRGRLRGIQKKGSNR